jgi:membrane protease YdiL (CAAX protease family)
MAREEAFPGVASALWLMLALWMVEMLVHALLMASGQFSREERMASWVLAMVLGNALVSVTWLTMHGLGYRDVLHPAPSSARVTLALLAGPLLLIVPALLIVQGVLSDFLVSLFPMESWHERMFSDLTGSGIASVAGVVLVAPFVEEFLFRGIILRGLLRAHSPGRAILMSSLLFGAAHLNLYQFVGAAFMGLLLGWIYLRFRSVLPCVLLHAMYNAAILFIPGVAGVDGQLDAGVWVAALPAFLLGASALRALARRA